MPYTIYYVIYAISNNDFRIVSDKNSRSIQFYSDYATARGVKESLMKKNPNIHYHIREFKMESKFLKEFYEL